MAAGKLIMNKASGGVLNVTSTDGVTSTDLVLPLSGTVTNVTTAVTDNAIARFDGTTGTLQNSGVVIDDNGNIGIGISNPTYSIHVSSSSEAAIRLQNTGAGGCWLRFDPVTAGYIWGYTNTPIIFGTNNSERARFTPNGDFLLTSGTGGLGYGTGAGGTVSQLTSKSTAVTLNKPSGAITMNNSALAAGASVYFTVNNSVLSLTDGIIITQNDNGIYQGVNYDIKVGYKTNGSFGVIVKNVSATTLNEAVTFRFDIIKGVNS